MHNSNKGPLRSLKMDSVFHGFTFHSRNCPWQNSFRMFGTPWWSLLLLQTVIACPCQVQTLWVRHTSRSRLSFASFWDFSFFFSFYQKLKDLCDCWLILARFAVQSQKEKFKEQASTAAPLRWSSLQVFSKKKQRHRNHFPSLIFDSTLDIYVRKMNQCYCSLWFKIVLSHIYNISKSICRKIYRQQRDDYFYNFYVSGIFRYFSDFFLKSHWFIPTVTVIFFQKPQEHLCMLFCYWFLCRAIERNNF